MVQVDSEEGGQSMSGGGVEIDDGEGRWMGWKSGCVTNGKGMGAKEGWPSMGGRVIVGKRVGEVVLESTGMVFWE